MAKLTKKMKAIKAGVDSTKAYEINEFYKVDKVNIKCMESYWII